MDARSEKALEFDKIRMNISEFTVSEMGKRLAIKIEPYDDKNIIKKRLKIISIP